MKTFVNTPDKGLLNLREEPLASARVLTRIPYGTQLEVANTTATWSEVTYNGIKGYVMNKFLGESKIVTRAQLQEIYNSLKSTLKTIEDILK